MISHRFTKMIKVTTCDFCYKQVIIGLRCKECKFKCHRDCEAKVPPSCGLPPAFIDVFVDYLTRHEGKSNLKKIIFIIYKSLVLYYKNNNIDFRFRSTFT
jgi:hypothetical protein